MNKTYATMLLTLGLASASAQAQQTTYYVAGSRNLTGSKWEISESNAMTYVNDSIASITYRNVPTGVCTFKVTDRTEWWGLPDGRNVVATVYEKCDVTIEFNTRTKAVTYKGEHAGNRKKAGERKQAYYLSGSGRLTGYSWGIHEELALVFNNDSIGTITMRNIAPGAYPFKITDGALWWGCDNGGNVIVTVMDTCDVTIQFNGNNKRITCTGDHLGQHKLEAEKMYISGTLRGNWTVGEETLMTKTGDGTYSIKVEDVKAGNYQFKFTTGAEWIDNWGTDDRCEPDTKYEASYDGFNIDVQVAKRGTVEIFLDISDFNTETHAGGTFWYTITQK